MWLPDESIALPVFGSLAHSFCHGDHENLRQCGGARRWKLIWNSENLSRVTHSQSRVYVSGKETLVS